MLKDRLKSAAVLLSLAMVAFFFSGVVGAAVFMGMCLFLLYHGLREFFNFTDRLQLPGYRQFTLVGAIILCVIAVWRSMACSGGISWFNETAVLHCFMMGGFLMAFRSTDFKEGLTRMLISLAGFIYIAWSLHFILKIFFFDGLADSGRMLALFMILVTKSSDIGAYFTGSFTAKRPGGNHKMAPRLSPKKSWEGFAGGVVFSLLVGAIIMVLVGEPVTNHLSWTFLLIFAPLAATLGFIGDVAESCFKRASDLKDSGELLPGMGGAMDVLDSLIPVAPLFYLYINVI